MIRLAVRVAPGDAELVLVELLDLAPAGLEETMLDDGRVEYALYGAPGELPALPKLRAAAAGAVVEVVTTEIADDWPERWRDFHRPVEIADRLYVRPPWLAPSATPGLIDIAIEPGQAFGTGGHATTRLCLELLLDGDANGGLLDVGSGSGVLAIAAAKLGFSPVIAVDHDQASIDATRRNARANAVSIDARRLDLRRDRLPDADTVTANLVAPLLAELARRLPAAPRRLIAGGLLVGQVDDAVAAYAATLSMHEQTRRERGDWAAVELLAG